MNPAEYINKGSYGNVYHYRDTETGNHYAVKRYNYNIREHGISADTLKDIVGYICFADVAIKNLVIDGNTVCVVMPYYGNNLSDIKNIPESMLKCIFYRVMTHMKYMHRYGVMHRDIKPENILYNTGLECKLIDFGIGAFSDLDYNKVVYSSWYRPPEVVLRGRYDQSAEVWALGLVLLESVYGTRLLPYDITRKEELERFHTDLAYHAPSSPSRPPPPPPLPPYLSGKQVIKPPSYSAVSTYLASSGKYSAAFKHIKLTYPDLFDLVSKMLRREPGKRPTIQQCLQHKWFNNINTYVPSPQVEFNQLPSDITQSGHELLVVDVSRSMFLHFNTILRLGDLIYIDVLSNAVYLYYSYVAAKDITFSGAARLEIIDECVHISVKLLCDSYSAAKNDPLHCKHDIELNIVGELGCNIRLFCSYYDKLHYMLDCNRWKTTEIPDIVPAKETAISDKILIRAIDLSYIYRYLLKNEYR